MKMNELSEALSLTTSTVTRMVDNLVRDDLIERGHDQFDRRLVIVRLTNKGKGLAKDIKGFKERYFDSIKEIVEVDGKEEMISSLKILIDAFENFKSKL
jgi:MarR family transcriptional regulator, organic hydroperoxide resistance regulator